MTRVFALALREITERKLLFLGAALIGLMTLLFPLMPVPGGYRYVEVVQVSAAVFALALMAGGGIVLGATTIGRDLSSGRLAFFFTRQLRAWEIWVGRILGMLVAVVISVVIVALPAIVISGGTPSPSALRGDSELPVAMIFALMLPLVAHYVSVALRSRSAWLAFDVVAMCAAGGVLWTLSLPFLPYWLGTPKALGAIFALLTLFLALAGWVGLAKGRITPVAVHRWSLVTLWSLVVIALLSFAAWRAWVFAASPQEIEWSKGWASEIDGNGEWIGVGSGEEKGRGGIPHEFLMSTKTGAWLRVDDSQSVSVSADRRIAVIAKRSWAWRPPSWSETTIQTVDLTAARPRVRATGIVQGLWDTPALSPDGSRVVVRESSNVAVYSLSDEKLLAAFPGEERSWPIMSFLDNGTLLVISSKNDESIISTFDIARRERVARNVFKGGRFKRDRTGAHVAITASTTDKNGTVAIYETKSGVKLGEIPFIGSAFGRRLHWLADGGIALASIEPTPLRAGVLPATVQAAVTIHALDGTERLRVPLPGAKRIVIAGEQRRGELIVVWATNENVSSPCAGTPHVVAIDLTSGSLRELPFKGWPRAGTWRVAPEPGGASSRLFSTCDGAMVMFDAATGEARALLGGK
ncbi:MAG: hypothetical protein WC538_23840 [Thermoanaerobaculia bacterium]|jgi:hypothetical protein